MLHRFLIWPFIAGLRPLNFSLEKVRYRYTSKTVRRIFIPRHTLVAGYYVFTLAVRVSVRPSVVRPSALRFRSIT